MKICRENPNFGTANLYAIFCLATNNIFHSLHEGFRRHARPHSVLRIRS